MILYLYALADGLDDVSGLAGVHDETLVIVSLPEAIAVGGWMPEAPAVTRESLASQDRLVRQLHARAAGLLPMRYGAAVSDVEAAARAVHALGAGLRDRLERVRARDQMTLRITGAGVAGGVEAPEGAEGPEGAGTRYLRARAALAVPPEIAPLLEALKPLQRVTRVERGRHANVLATVYQLIDKGSAEVYWRAAEDAAATRPSLTIRISGPSPAYAFAGP